ncbi:MAG TPA: hypothetical protein DIU39_08665 [Flavobacteriales bacterium]|nr:hypothetical protein [Flavobacteriales bacterium]|tara:strand:+ start:17967 stop:18308 length:342 start_codon:yes stop_codon:yes gene_type:complete
MSQTDERTIAVLSYLTPLGWIIAFVIHQNNVVKSPFAAFHIRQALGIYLLGLALTVIGIIFSILPLIGPLTLFLARLITVVLWLFGLYYAIDRRPVEVPVVGSLFQVWFQGIV